MISRSSRRHCLHRPPDIVSTHAATLRDAPQRVSRGRAPRTSHGPEGDAMDQSANRFRAMVRHRRRCAAARICGSCAAPAAIPRTKICRARSTPSWCVRRMRMRGIRAIATDKAKAMPGVLAVLTGADCLADGLKPIPHKPWSPHPAETQLRNKGDEPPFEAPHFPLPADKARFVGEAVAMVVAETVHAAKDGAERSRSITKCCPRWSRPSPRRARMRRTCTTARVQCLLRRRARRCRGDRGGVRPRRACDAVRDLGAARHRRADGAARRARRIRRRDGTLHGLCRQWRRGAAEERSRHHARRAAGARCAC